MDEPPPPPVDPPSPRRCAVCGEDAAFGFGPPGSAEAWYCGTHRQDGERAWAARYRPSPSGLGDGLL
jgi:hypothetical protein